MSKLTVSPSSISATRRTTGVPCYIQPARNEEMASSRFVCCGTTALGLLPPTYLAPSTHKGLYGAVVDWVQNAWFGAYCLFGHKSQLY